MSTPAANDIVVNEPNRWRLESPGARGWTRTARPGAPNKYFIVSADCHANEPSSLWADRIDQKYKDRGLVVIGVHSAQDGDKAGALLKEKGYTFPVAVDQGPTAERYAIEAWPTYFLIDKSGKVAWGPGDKPPTESQIEEMLK